MLKHAQAHMAVMHPLPRNDEISEEVDFDPRAAYFRQVCCLPRNPLLPYFVVAVMSKFDLLLTSCDADEARTVR